MVIFFNSLLFLVYSLEIYSVSNLSTVMSLGSDCEVAHQLRRKGLISGYFPLDWVKSSDFEKVFELLKSDFKDFLNDKNLEEKGINTFDNPPQRAVLDT